MFNCPTLITLVGVQLDMMSQKMFNSRNANHNCYIRIMMNGRYKTYQETLRPASHSWDYHSIFCLVSQLQLLLVTKMLWSSWVGGQEGVQQVDHQSDQDCLGNPGGARGIVGHQSSLSRVISKEGAQVVDHQSALLRVCFKEGTQEVDHQSALSRVLKRGH